jgi:hypothetical protein
LYGRAEIDERGYHAPFLPNTGPCPNASGSSKEDNQVTETRMDNLESLKGTISDDMINTDESTDEAPLDAAPAASKPANVEAPKTDATKAPPTETDPAGTTKPDTAGEPK